MVQCVVGDETIVPFVSMMPLALKSDIQGLAADIGWPPDLVVARLLLMGLNLMHARIDLCEAKMVGTNQEALRACLEGGRLVLPDEVELIEGMSDDDDEPSD